MKKLLLPVLLFAVMTVFAQEKPIPLYPNGIPNSKPAPADYVETIVNNSGSMVITPTLTPYLPEKGKATGTAVVICPGGGYSHLALGHEGIDIAKKFNEIGVTAFVLKYRLPSDDEWSMAAYLSREIGTTPAERSLRIEGIYPWGYTWPPPSKTGNFLDKASDKSGKKGIPGYNDGRATVSPVASFRADGRGLYDLSGNVWEWVADSWKDAPDQGVLRGGAYTTTERQELLASFRRQATAAERHPDAGFRLLLWNIGQSAREDED